MILAKTIIYLVLISSSIVLLIFNLFYHKQALKGERLLALHISPALQRLSTIDLLLSWLLIGAIFFFLLLHFLTEF